MLHNCGNSSRLFFRKNEPIGVRNISGLLSKWVATAGVSTRMLRNLGIRKRRLFFPTRSLQYSAGPGELNRTASQMIKPGTAINIASMKAAAKSKKRFIPADFIDGQQPVVMQNF